MKRREAAVRVSLLACVLVVAVGCGGDKVRRQIECTYTYEKEAIALTLAASTDLNTYNNLAHPVHLILYQLSNPNTFSQMLESPDGVNRLLEGKSFDASVLSQREVVVQPGKSREILMDRVKGTRYLGVVAGFYNQQGQNYSRLLPVPTQMERSFFGRDKGCYSVRMEAALQLGSGGFVGSP